MKQLEKINLIKIVPSRIFFFDDDIYYKIYNENLYWFCKKLQPIKINKASNKKNRLVFVYGSIPKASLVYLKEEYSSEFKEIKFFKYGFSIEVFVDLEDYNNWVTIYKKNE